MPTKQPAKLPRTPLAAAVSSKKNAVRVTRHKDGAIRFKFTGPVAFLGVVGFALDLTPIFAPESALWIALGLGAFVAAALLWLGWTWFVQKDVVDRSPAGNHFEGTRRRTGGGSLAAKGSAAWLLAVALVVGAFLFLYPPVRWGVYAGFGGAFLVGAAGIAWVVKQRRDAGSPEPGPAGP